MKTFLAIYTAPPTDSPPAMDPKAMQAGMQAWGDWMGRHAGDIEVQGGPLGRTKRVSKAGVADTRNNATGFIVVRAESQEAAAKMFENHPSFAIFPGDGVEVMEILPIPTGP
jgi:hypothetical protein